MTRSLPLLFLLCCGAMPICALEKETTEVGGATITVWRHTLENGLTILMQENHRAPTLGLCAAFRVGSVDEWDGMSGATHILEHMLFKGSETIGSTDFEKERVLLRKIESVRVAMQIEKRKGVETDSTLIVNLQKKWNDLRERARLISDPEEFGRIFTANGARGLNAFTSCDVTAYMVGLPSNRLELWLYLESERLQKPVLREFYTEIENIREERRMAVEDNARAKLLEECQAAAFQAHRYGVEIIGWDSDLQTINRSEIEDYFQSHYAPNRLILSLVGDLDPARTVVLIEAYFGDAEKMPDPDPVDTVEPPQKGERRIEVEFDAEPLVWIGFHKPTVGHPDNPALLLTHVILNRGRSSRLQENVVDRNIAKSISSSVDSPGERFPNLIYFGAEIQAPHTSADVEQAIAAELERLGREPVDPEELSRAKTYVETNYVRTFTDNLDCAVNLAYDEAALGNWMTRTAEILECREVTASDIRRVASTYFRKSNRTVGRLIKPETGGS